jgi:hypothetical protein
MSEQDETEFNEATDEETSALDGDENIIVAEPKQPMSRSTLVMFVILIVGAAGLYVMYRKAGPRSAGAATVADPIDPAKQTITTFLSGGDANVRNMEKLLHNTEKVVQQFVNYPKVTQIPLSDLRTNPFRQHAVVTKTDDRPTSEMMQKKQREEQRLANLKAVQMLQLQSIMFSETRKACMINNSLYREGQSVDNFSIEKISPSSVIVKNGLDRFELRMQR